MCFADNKEKEETLYDFQIKKRLKNNLYYIKKALHLRWICRYGSVGRASHS